MSYSAPPPGRACLRSGCRLRGGEGRVLRQMRGRAPLGDAIVQSSCHCDARERSYWARVARLQLVITLGWLRESLRSTLHLYLLHTYLLVVSK